MVWLILNEKMGKIKILFFSNPDIDHINDRSFIQISDILELKKDYMELKSSTLETWDEWVYKFLEEGT